MKRTHRKKASFQSAGFAKWLAAKTEPEGIEYYKKATKYKSYNN